MRHAIASIRLAQLALVLAMCGGPGATAHAEDGPFLKRQLGAPSNALELQLSGGYTQGLGNLGPDTGIGHVAAAGVGFTGDVAYRATPYVSLDAEAQYQYFVAYNENSAQGLDTNVGVTVHTLPKHRGDPWIRVGTGWRWVWQTDRSNPFGVIVVGVSNQYQGWDILNFRVGLDIRSTHNLAWAPVIGANLQSFLFVNGNPVSSAQFGTFLYAGVQGRFDMTTLHPINVD